MSSPGGLGHLNTTQQELTGFVLSTDVTHMYAFCMYKGPSKTFLQSDKTRLPAHSPQNYFRTQNYFNTQYLVILKETSMATK